MLHAEHSVTISRPSKAVFDYLADGTHNPDWRTGVVEIRRTTQADGQGASYRQVLTGPGLRADVAAVDLPSPVRSLNHVEGDHA